MPMKKLFTLMVCLFAGFSVQAQSDFPLQFVDKDGQVIPDGTWLDITEFEEDDIFGEIMVPAKVWVKNVSDEMVYGGGSYTIQCISNGSFQTCFPSNCMSRSSEGTFTTGKEAIMPSQLRDMQTEWLPEGEGMCLVTYQLLTFRKVGNNYLPDGDGPAITLSFLYGNVTGITTPAPSEGAEDEMKNGKWFNLSGQATNYPRRGIYIKRTTHADGTSEIKKYILH